MKITNRQKKIYKFITEKVIGKEPDLTSLDNEYSIYTSFSSEIKIPIYPSNTFRLEYRGQYCDLSIWITPEGMIIYCFDTIDRAGVLKSVTTDLQLFELRDLYKKIR